MRWFEEESARFLKEARSRGLIFRRSVKLTGQKVIDFAGEAANGAFAHVGLTTGANVPSIQDFARKFMAKYGRDTDHNGIRGCIGIYAIRYVTEMLGEFNQEALAQKMHGLTLDVADHPGMLLTTSWDDTGEMARESFMTTVKDGKQVVIGTVPAK